MQVLIIILYTVGIGLWSMKKSKSSDSFHGAAMGVFASLIFKDRKGTASAA